MSTSRRRRVLAVAAALGLALAVPGCAPAPETEPPRAGPSTSPPAATPPSPVPTATPTAAATPGVPSPSAPPATRPSASPVSARVTVQRSGGFAGVTQKIVVERDGSWRYSASRGLDAPTVKTGRLGAAQLKRLRLLLGDPSFGSAFYPGSCADGFHYSLLTGQRRVEWDECGGTNPAAVARAIVALLADATPF